MNDGFFLLVLLFSVFVVVLHRATTINNSFNKFPLITFIISPVVALQSQLQTQKQKHRDRDREIEIVTETKRQREARCFLFPEDCTSS